MDIDKNIMVRLDQDDIVDAIIRYVEEDLRDDGIDVTLNSSHVTISMEGDIAKRILATVKVKA